MRNPQPPTPGAPENPEEGLSFPGEDGQTSPAREIVDDTKVREITPSEVPPSGTEGEGGA
jgi:hypothetical protein